MAFGLLRVSYMMSVDKRMEKSCSQSRLTSFPTGIYTKLSNMQSLLTALVS